MTTFVGLLIAAYLAAVADTSFAPAMAIHGIAPCFLLLVVVVGTVRTPASPWRTLQMAGVGLVFDLNTSSHVGIGMVAFTLLAAAASHARAMLRRWGPIELTAVTAPALLATLALIGAGNGLPGHAMPFTVNSFARVVGASVYTAVLGLPIWLIADWLHDAFRHRLPRSAYP